MDTTAPLYSPDSDSSNSHSYFPSATPTNHGRSSSVHSNTSMSTRKTCTRLATLFAESHPSHHVLVLSYEASEGNLQLEGALSGSLPSAREYDQVLYASEDGDRLYRVYIFTMGRFRYEGSRDSSNTYAFASNSASPSSPSFLGGHIFFDQLIC